MELNKTAQNLDTNPLRVLLARIEETYHPLQVWLFGSRARGDNRPDSDWDLFVIVPDDTPEERLDPVIAWRLQRGAGVYADVIPCRACEFHEASDTVNTLSYVITQEGVLLYDR